jgi:hypothetical protein
MFAAMRADTHVFTDAYATVAGIVLHVDGRRMAVTLVTGNFFQVVRVNPVIGRGLFPADDARSGGNAVIVLSHKGWDRHFNRDPNVLGRTVLVNGAPFAIVGVTAAGFRGLEVGGPDAWAPLSQLGQFRPADHGRKEAAGVEIVGRLRPGVSKDNARAQLAAWDSNQSADTRDRRSTTIELLPRRGTVLRAALRRLRIDPDDRMRQRRQPVAGAGSGAAARDRHSTLAWRIAAAHCPPVDD